MDTPVMMSALVRGILFTVMHTWRVRRFRLRKPMAAAVPMTVEMTAASTDTARVTHSASRMVLFWKSWTYQFRVKPVHTALDLAALKEKTTSTRMGA